MRVSMDEERVVVGVEVEVVGGKSGEVDGKDTAHTGIREEGGETEEKEVKSGSCSI